MQQPPAPFSCKYTPNLPEFLMQMQASIIITTYQAGKVIFISSKNENELVQLPRTFHKPMGVALQGDKMAIATKDEVVVLVNDKRIAPVYPRKPNTYDNFFLPRATYYTGQVDIHDLDYGTAGLWAVNTSFSCLTLVNDDFSFVPKWQPHFISDLASEDRCHLNGMALQNGKPTFVTALGTGNTPQSWRQNIVKGGVLMDVSTNEIVTKGLAMPHSPRFYKNDLMVLLSAAGEFGRIDTTTGKYETVTKLNAFVRGLAIVGDFAFIGVSKLRQNSSTFKDLEIAKLSSWSGVSIVHIPSGAVAAQLQYLASVDEIYDIQILPNASRPNILNHYTEDYKKALSIPETTFWARD
jgi:uncharacterized protein (TIGR03032 family)